MCPYCQTAKTEVQQWNQTPDENQTLTEGQTITRTVYTFQMLPFETRGGIQKIKMCRLNREQATFVISLMKNTKPVVMFKAVILPS